MSNGVIESIRNLLFSQRNGHIAPPDVMDLNLCKKFRNSLWDILQGSISAYAVDNDQWSDNIWRNTATVFQQDILNVSLRETKTSPLDVLNIILNVVEKGESHIVLSLIELILRNVHYYSQERRMLSDLFQQNLAPYAIDASAEPVCIIPIDCPENSENIINSLETLHETDAERSHQHLRKAAEHINSDNYNGAVAESTHALESIARDITGKNTLGAAVKALHSQGIIPHQALSDAIGKLYGFASDTARHGQPSDKPVAIDRDDALLVFGLSTSLSAYLARKKMEVSNE